MIKDNFSRVSNIVCDKGKNKNGFLNPTYKEVEETSYIDFDNIVYFQLELTKDKNLINEKIDIKKCFENFHSK